MNDAIVETRYTVPATIDGRVIIPAAQSGLIWLASAVLTTLVAGVLLPWPADLAAAAYQVGALLAFAMALGGAIASVSVISLIVRANKSDMHTVLVHVPSDAADLDQDGEVEPEEIADVAALLTEAGLVAFCDEWLYRRAAWSYRDLVDKGPFTRELYQLVVQDILPTMGVLHPAPARHTPRLRAANANEAASLIGAYLGQGHRRVWSIEIEPKGGDDPVKIVL
ncbi:MAG: hypothetical protein KKA73_00710 [Chloroflexi bacterium]|nr:hypothetical protein [Chloroflexota bacterium]MBU1746183.1 hypothetical protein [Chloroflexota bacterium]